MSSLAEMIGQSTGGAPSWLAGARQNASPNAAWQNGGMYYQPIYGNPGGTGENYTPPDITDITEWNVYGVDKTNPGDEYERYDANGNFIGKGRIQNVAWLPSWEDLRGPAMIAAAAFGGNLLSGAGASGAGAGTATGATTGASGGSSGLYSLGGVYGGTGLGLSAPSGALGTGAATTGLGAAGTAAVTGWAGLEGNAGQGLSVIPGVGTNLITETGGGLGLNPPSPAVVPGSNIRTTIPTNPLGTVGSGISLGPGSGVTIPGVSTTTPGGTSTGGLDLGSLIAGLLSGYQNNQNSKDILGYLDKQQADIDKLYAPGSPEYDYLMKQIERKDAASGRNSQYGPRSVELAAKIAQIKAEQKARLAIGGSQYAVPAIQQGNSTLNGLLAALGGANAAGYTIPQVVQNISSIIGSLFGDK